MVHNVGSWPCGWLAVTALHHGSNLLPTACVFLTFSGQVSWWCTASKCWATGSRALTSTLYMSSMGTTTQQTAGGQAALLQGSSATSQGLQATAVSSASYNGYFQYAEPPDSCAASGALHPLTPAGCSSLGLPPACWWARQQEHWQTSWVRAAAYYTIPDCGRCSYLLAPHAKQQAVKPESQR